jgi:hypothetical protein
MLTWIVFLVLVCGTHAQSLFAAFNHTLYIHKHSTHPTHFDLKDAGNKYLQNVSNTPQPNGVKTQELNQHQWCTYINVQEDYGNQNQMILPL